MKSQAIVGRERQGRRPARAGTRAKEATDGTVSSPPRAHAESSPDPRVPSSYPRRVLLAVTGLSPQVVTETLYALAMELQPAFVPTEIHLLTTSDGAERARLTLLSREPGWFHRLCRDFRLPPIEFNPHFIHVMAGATDVPLADIRSPADNERAADFITEEVRKLTLDPGSALHVSIAGGRKTMGFYLGSALSLFGRSQDRLSHVLVSAPFEGHPDFFYPTRLSQVIYANDKARTPLDTREAKVTLAEIPFVRLREGFLPERLLAGRATFSGTVNAAQRALGPSELLINLREGLIQAGGEPVQMPPAELAFYAWLARRCKDGDEPILCPADGTVEPGYAQEYLAEYRRIIGEMGDDDRTAGRLAAGMDKAFFMERKSKVDRHLQKALGYGARPYLICGIGSRPRTRYGLRLDRTAIRFAILD